MFNVPIEETHNQEITISHFLKPINRLFSVSQTPILKTESPWALKVPHACHLHLEQASTKSPPIICRMCASLKALVLHLSSTVTTRKLLKNHTRQLLISFSFPLYSLGRWLIHVVWSALFLLTTHSLSPSSYLLLFAYSLFSSDF